MSSQPRILFVSDVAPWPTDSGGRQRTCLLLRALAQHARVDLFLLTKGLTGHPPEVIDRLGQDHNLVYHQLASRKGKGLAKIIRPIKPILRHLYAGQVGSLKVSYDPDPALLNALEACLEKQTYDLIVGRYLLPTARAGVLQFRPVLIDVDDLDSDRCRSQLETPGTSWLVRSLLKRRLAKLEREEPAALAKAQHLWVCSTKDRDQLGSDRATVLSNIPFTLGNSAVEVCQPSGDSHQTILFVGSLDYVVNERGLDRFIKQSWPTIIKSMPDARLRIVGSGLTKEQRDRWSAVDGVEPAGFAEDLGKAYAEAAFTVVPLFEGGGSKIKVVESLSFGRTCVTSWHALRGFEHVLKHSESLWAGEDDQALADGCIKLLRNPDLRNKLAGLGQRQVAAHFTFEAFSRIVGDTLKAILESNTGGVQEGGQQS